MSKDRIACIHCGGKRLRHKGYTLKHRTVKYKCLNEKCGKVFSESTDFKESGTRKFYRVRAIQLYLEGVNAKDIKKIMKLKSIAHVYSLLGGTEKIDYLKTIRLSGASMDIKYVDHDKEEIIIPTITLKQNFLTTLSCEITNNYYPIKHEKEPYLSTYGHHIHFYTFKKGSIEIIEKARPNREALTNRLID